MEDKFIKIYKTEPFWVNQINMGEMNLLIQITEGAYYDKNVGGYIIVMNGFKKRQIADALNISNTTSISNVLTSLVKKKIICRVDTGTYLINPNFVGFSDNKNCSKAKAYFPSIEELGMSYLYS